MMPTEPQPRTEPPSEGAAIPAPESPYRWYHKILAVLFCTFCLEIGCFLLVFPWTSYATDFAAFRPQWQNYWDNPYVKGAISGLGLINLYISFVEIVRLRRFAKR